MTVNELNALPSPAARDAFTACCGAPAWVSRMVARRPFASRAALFDAADASWRTLAPDEWKEAIAHHPRIGESRAAASTSARADAWSASEQSAARADDGAADGVAGGLAHGAALAEGNAEYERRFGHVFIICASGRSAGEILEALRTRLRNDAATELAATSEELRKITQLRLEKLLGEQ